MPEREEVERLAPGGISICPRCHQSFYNEEGRRLDQCADCDLAPAPIAALARPAEDRA